ncbi:DUF2510 domain-containing protein [Microbacterium rhizosphaerae]|uniref:DUF2510 domain-containing protein n=1 Tax=Microbacterium rhizosphaerae TaxID=1678237 RepID=A0ABZ0SNL3_9MICO|nr:DUF2510 domain-containing protein [Microbacterium rhizosphaerae]WPR90929.1 DUF2510 domain-containing protein [Microbacterium rhizosphaerae]
MVAAAEPGWYDDGTGAMRWWDGSRWTEHFADFGFGVELHTGAAPAASPTAAGWYDDGRGRMRWWDGRRWTAQSRFSGGEESYAGVVVDGRWIHLGERSQPVAGVVAVVDSLERIGKRSGFARAAHAKALFDPRGRVTWHQFGRLDRRVLGLAIESADQAWITFPRPGDEARARQFAGWITASAEHYRYR